MRDGRFRWSYFAAALALALFLHVEWIIPKVLAPLTEKPDVPVEIAFVPDPSDTAADEKKLDEEKRPDDRSQPEKQKIAVEKPKPKE
ncbi:MAG TPA: hypothetical protein VFF06_05265, partial [Polyangia bacterium]|nr:hypothetical protein [Polyangia bacterium]